MWILGPVGNWCYAGDVHERVRAFCTTVVPIKDGKVVLLVEMLIPAGLYPHKECYGSYAGSRRGDFSRLKASTSEVRVAHAILGGTATSCKANSFRMDCVARASRCLLRPNHANGWLCLQQKSSIGTETRHGDGKAPYPSGLFLSPARRCESLQFSNMRL